MMWNDIYGIYMRGKYVQRFVYSNCVIYHARLKDKRVYIEHIETDMRTENK